MNDKFQDEKMTTNSKEKKVNLLFSYKDKLIPKFKILPNLKNQIEKKSFSKFFDEESSIKSNKIKTPIIKLDQIKFNYNRMKSNNINIISNKNNNNSFGLKNNTGKIFDNFFLINLKENKYLSPINQKKNSKVLFKSSSFSNIKQKILLGNSTTNKHLHIHNISYIKDFDNNNSIDKNRNYFRNILNKSNSQKNFNIRQKFLFHRNKEQKIFFNKSFKNFINKSDKSINSNSKNNSFNSISIKELNPKISDNKESNNLNIKKIHGYDLRLKELFKKNKNNENKEKVNEEIKQYKSQILGRFFDKLPSLIMKKNIELGSPSNKIDIENLGKKAYSFTTSVKKEENQKKELNKLIQSQPIIRYKFLQKILNSLVHKVKLFGENKEKLVINSNTMIKLNEEIKDFITYGYEFIPEEFLKNKDLESTKELLKDEEFLNLIFQTKSSIDSSINNNTKNTKTITQIKPNFGFHTDTEAQMNFNSAKEEYACLKIFQTFMEQESKRNKINRKSTFLYKRIHINKKNNYNYKYNNINRVSLNKSTNYDYTTFNNNKNNNSNFLNKTQNVSMFSKDKDRINNNGEILSQMINILYDDIYDLDNIIRKDKKEKEKRNYNIYRENFWKKLLDDNNNKNEIVYYKPEIKKRIRSGKGRNKNMKNIKNILHISYLFESIEERMIKSAKHYLEISLDEDDVLLQRDSLYNTSKNIKQRKFDFSKVNVFYKSNLKLVNKIKSIKQNINLMKKPEKVDKILENIPETNFIFKSKSKKKEKEKNSIINKFFSKSRKFKIKSLKKLRKKKIFEIQKNKTVDEIKEIPKEIPEENHEEKQEENQEEKHEEKPEEKPEENPEEKPEEKPEENKNDNILEKTNDNDNNINIHPEDTLYIKKDIKEIRQENTIIIPKKKKKTYNDVFKFNLKELFNGDNKKEDENSDSKSEDSIQFFKDMEGKSLMDIEKKKIELLYKFKHDIIYKISTGEMSSEEMDTFLRFKEKIEKLKKIYNEYDLRAYIKEMEIFFQSLKDEIENNLKRKIEEDRINSYLNNYRKYYYSKKGYRDFQISVLGKILNFSQINHINILNDE